MFCLEGGYDLLALGRRCLFTENKSCTVVDVRQHVGIAPAALFQRGALLGDVQHLSVCGNTCGPAVGVTL